MPENEKAFGAAYMQIREEVTKRINLLTSDCSSLRLDVERALAVLDTKTFPKESDVFASKRIAKNQLWNLRTRFLKINQQLTRIKELICKIKAYEPELTEEKQISESSYKELLLKLAETAPSLAPDIAQFLGYRATMDQYGYVKVVTKNAPDLHIQDRAHDV